MRVWSRLGQPEPPETPVEVCLHLQSAAGPPRSRALFSLFCLINVGKSLSASIKKFDKANMNLECFNGINQL